MTKEEISRIMRLVQEGKLSPEDAAELIDAFNTAEGQEGSSNQEPPPPPDPTGTTPPPFTGHKDPFKGFVDFMEGVGKEVSQSVNWHEVARQVRVGAQKGAEGLRQGIEQLKKGEFNIGFFSTYETKDFTLPLTLAEGKTLRIENPAGDIKVTGGFETGSIHARAKVRGSDVNDAKDKADNYTLIVEESDHQVLVRQPDVSGIEVDVVVQLGKASNIEIKSESGDVRLLDTGGGCRVNTQSGDVHVQGLNGTIEVTTQNGDLNMESVQSPSIAIENKSGDISLRDINGNLNARSASGDISAKRLSGKTISVESVNGDVDLDIVEPVSGTLNVRTVNGDAVLQIQDTSDCRVSLSTLRGEVSCSVPLQDEAKMEQRITGRLGAGTGAVDLSAVNGDVCLKWRDSSGA